MSDRVLTVSTEDLDTLVEEARTTIEEVLDNVIWGEIEAVECIRAVGEAIRNHVDDDERDKLKLALVALRVAGGED